MENKVEIYYDNFKSRQIKTGLNARHRFIITSLKRAGLKKHHHVWEIGCGIGVISGKLAKFVSKGNVLGVDLSSKSIEFAKNKYSKLKNIRFIASDILNAQISEKFDVIVMPDVLEHIPKESHLEIFAKLRTSISNNGFLCINIPTADYLEYLSVNNPEKLQIIDQPIEANELITNAEKNGFQLTYFKTYSLFIDKNDYRLMIFKTKQPYKSVNFISGLNKNIREAKSILRFFING